MKPLLFNTQMVQAIDLGNKTMTRRAVKMDFQKVYAAACANNKWNPAYGSTIETLPDELTDWYIQNYLKPPFDVGDVIYVRETWAEMPYGYVYRALEERPVGWDSDDKWRPSIHCPKEASRIFLSVVSVRRERMLDITEEDAVKEGFSAGRRVITEGPWGVEDDPDEWTARDAFLELWETTIKKSEQATYGINGDPWVWVIEFEKISKEEAYAIDHVRKMTLDELYDMVTEQEKQCEACLHQFDCNGHPVSGGPNGPIYAPCGESDPENWIDEDAAESVCVQIVMDQIADGSVHLF